YADPNRLRRGKRGAALSAEYSLRTPLRGEDARAQGPQSSACRRELRASSGSGYAASSRASGVSAAGCSPAVAPTVSAASPFTTGAESSVSHAVGTFSRPASASRHAGSARSSVATASSTGERSMATLAFASVFASLFAFTGGAGRLRSHANSQLGSPFNSRGNASPASLISVCISPGPSGRSVTTSFGSHGTSTSSGSAANARLRNSTASREIRGVNSSASRNPAMYSGNTGRDRKSVV